MELLHRREPLCTAPRRRPRLTAAGAVLVLLGSLTGASPGTTEPEKAASSAPDRRQAAAEAFLRGQAAESASLYAELLAAEPGDGMLLAGRVRALIAVDRWRDAFEEARRFHAAHPGDPEATSALGEALHRAGRLAEAEATLEPLVASASPPPRALVTLALLRVARGRDDDGAALLDRALAASPEDRHVLFHAAGAAATRAAAVALLERYLARSAGDDPDRIEGARGTVRLYRALGERRVWIPANRPERVELPLLAIPGAGGRSAGYVVEAVVGERKRARLLVDTGSASLFLVERIAEKGGFAPLAEETAFGGGGDGRHATRTGILPSIALGDLRYADALVRTTGSELEPTGRYHGLLGLHAFAGYRVTLDLDRGKLVLEPPPPSPAGVPYWTVSGQLLVDVSAVNGPSGLFLLDTGAARSHVASSFAEGIPGTTIGEPTAVRGFGGTLRGTRILRGAALTFSGIRSRTDPFVVSDLTTRSHLGGVELSGFLGLDLLDGHRISIDTRARRVEAR